MIAAASREAPDLILAPMLKIAIPEEVWSRHLTPSHARDAKRIASARVLTADLVSGVGVGLQKDAPGPMAAVVGAVHSLVGSRVESRHSLPSA
ncbi:MAG: hypothetical protein ACLP4V_16140 [Methylocella sp.]